MPDTQLLLVLAVQEAGLRSALTAQLGLAGANLITTSDVDNPALLRGVRRPAVLVLDDVMISERPPKWLDGALADLRWREIVLLTVANAACAEHPKLLRLDAKNAVRVLAEKIPHWKAGDAAA